MKDRDMYYGNYGYGGFIPLNNGANIPNQMPGIIDNTGNNYANSFFNDINDRLDRLERQIKRLDQRLTRIETPYANNNYNNEPDNNMYMM